MRSIIICMPLLLCLLSAFQTRKKKLRLPGEFVLVPPGTYWQGPEDSGKRVSIEGFYMSKYEVSNRQYRQFLSETLPGLSAAGAQKILTDTLGWSKELESYETYMMFYHSHPSYNYYPAVNISYEGALAYCKWLQEKIAKDNPGYHIEVKLPDKTQWIWASRRTQQRRLPLGQLLPAQ
jgi:formylglycine-generating enzyme required for sulfatase activity